ncbi:hypothetical protein K438DRAFT_1769526 [Mycena galopus ATCC 62051]|nr:hypothetical protein K438DRAFT_1769526 [Mycena galopus ATCC 62051]
MEVRTCLLAYPGRHRAPQPPVLGAKNHRNSLGRGLAANLPWMGNTGVSEGTARVYAINQRQTQGRCRGRGAGAEAGKENEPSHTSSLRQMRKFVTCSSHAKWGAVKEQLRQIRIPDMGQSVDHGGLTAGAHQGAVKPQFRKMLGYRQLRLMTPPWGPLRLIKG